jgi:hypothetical protein
MLSNIYQIEPLPAFTAAKKLRGRFDDFYRHHPHNFAQPQISPNPPFQYALEFSANERLMPYEQKNQPYQRIAQR